MFLEILKGALKFHYFPGIHSGRFEKDNGYAFGRSVGLGLRIRRSRQRLLRISAKHGLRGPRNRSRPDLRITGTYTVRGGAKTYIRLGDLS